MLEKLKPALGVIFLTLAIFVLTKNVATKPFVLHMTLISLLVFLTYIYLVKKKGKVVRETKSFIFLLASFILFLVATTGWFFSPFFFSLYLLSIVFAFIFPPTVSISFVVTLVALFSLNIGEVDLAYDFLVVLSLLAVLPLSFYLRREYLQLKEAEKKILVLEKEGGASQGKLEEVLANKVNKFAVDIRQPINDIKQLAHRLGKIKEKEKTERQRHRIIFSSEEALKILKDFEQETTGKQLLSTPEET